MHFFVSYSRSDRDRVRKKKKDIEVHGHSVWMDDQLTPGEEWEAELTSEIERADRALIFLSRNTTRNYKYQQKEIQVLLQLAEKRPAGFLTPVRLESCPIPQGLQKLQTLDCFERGRWKAWLTRLLPERHVRVPRARFLPVAGKSLPLPIFFPSLSTTAKTTISVAQHIELLISVSQPQFLVSASDIYTLRSATRESSRRISELVTEARQKGQVVLLDSGNYEKFWKKLDSWTRARFHEVLSYVPVQLAFCYDTLTPSNSKPEIVSEIERGALKDRKAAGMEALLPIVHCPSPGMFPDVCAQVAGRLHPLMIAVPERELGAGLVERIDTIAAIRDALDEAGTYCPLHVLGTGNPRSMLLFAIAGADSFDGLEWCQTCVDHETFTLHHLSHIELYWHQTPVGKAKEIAPAARALTHNLFFYQDLMPQISSAMSSGKVGTFAMTVCGEANFARVYELSEGLRKGLRIAERSE